MKEVDDILALEGLKSASTALRTRGMAESGHRCRCQNIPLLDVMKAGFL